MTNEELNYLETHFREMLLYLSARKIENETEEKKAIEFRSAWRVLNTEKKERGTANKGKRKIKEKSAGTETKKEIKEMIRFSDCKTRERKNGYFEIRLRRGGINKSWSGYNLNALKRRCLAWISAENKKRRYFPPESFAPDSLLFGEFAGDFLYNVKKRMVKPETFRIYENIYMNHILPTFESLPLKAIKAAFVQSILNDLNEKAPRTCEDVKVLLNSIFTYALDNGEITRNPMKAVYIPKHERQTGEALTKAEEAKLISALKGHRMELTYILTLYTGVRACEVNTAVFNLQENTITFKNGKLKSYQKEKFRTVPIFPKLKPYIPRLVSENWRTHANNISRAMREFLPNTKHTFKDLRHTFTTRARECGIDNEIVSLWTGHSLGNITARVYTHFSPEFMQKEAEKLNYTL